jgi:hypothetical protein
MKLSSKQYAPKVCGFEFSLSLDKRLRYSHVNALESGCHCRPNAADAFGVKVRLKKAKNRIAFMFLKRVETMISLSKEAEICTPRSLPTPKQAAALGSVLICGCLAKALDTKPSERSTL